MNFRQATHRRLTNKLAKAGRKPNDLAAAVPDETTMQAVLEFSQRSVMFSLQLLQEMGLITPEFGSKVYEYGREKKIQKKRKNG